MTNQFLSAGVESYTLRICILCFVKLLRKYVHLLKYLQVFSCLVTFSGIYPQLLATLFLYESLFFTHHLTVERANILN